MVVALSLPRLLGRLANRPVMLTGGALLAVGLACGLLGPDLLWLLPIWFLLGAGSSMIQTPSGRLLRHSSREGARSAVYSSQFALSQFCWPATYPLVGWAGARLGIEATFALLADICGAATLAAVQFWPTDDHTGIALRHEAMDHERLIYTTSITGSCKKAGMAPCRTAIHTFTHANGIGTFRRRPAPSRLAASVRKAVRFR